jgi:hypothetical protein
MSAIVLGRWADGTQGEIFDADTRGHLVVNDAVQDSRYDAGQDDFN